MMDSALAPVIGRALCPECKESQGVVTDRKYQDPKIANHNKPGSSWCSGSGKSIDHGDVELTDIDYLDWLAERIMHIPVMHGVDQWDCDQLDKIRRTLIINQEWLKAEIAKIEADSRYHDKPALVQVNAPLALIQVEMKARKQTLEEVLERLT